MVPRPFAAARAMRSRTCADVIQPCLSDDIMATMQPRPQDPLSASREGGPWGRSCPFKICITNDLISTSRDQLLQKAYYLMISVILVINAFV